MDNINKPTNNTFGTLLALGLGGVIAWNLLPPDAKENVGKFLYQVNNALVVSQRRKAELERRQQIDKIIDDYASRPEILALLNPKLPVPLSVPLTSVASPALTQIEVVPSKPLNNNVYIDPDSIWLKRIIHPSIVLIIGKRGSGKSASSYRILELFRFGPKPYVVGVPASKRHLLPNWISIVNSLEEVPEGAIAIVDEAYIRYHARNSTAQESKEMSKLLNLSRQREQTLIFVSQESRQIDINIASSANVFIFKDPGLLQLKFDRPELNQLAIKARDAFDTISGDKMPWNYVYSPDADFSGLIKNELPSFWTPGLSRIFAGEVNPVPDNSKPRIAQTLTLLEKTQKAQEMKEQGASIREIARTLGVSTGTVINYLKGYPYKHKEIL
jgi:hypothetical protein